MNLVNAKQMSIEYPKTFEWFDCSKELIVGSCVKLCDGHERFWAHIKHISQTKNHKVYFGEAIGAYNEKYFDIIEFTAENIHDLYCP